SAIIMVFGFNGGEADVTRSINSAIALAIPLSVAGLFFTMIAHTISISIVHLMDDAAKKVNIRTLEALQFFALFIPGLPIA
ncbi:PTS sugar transporter subunit IIC, partial [Streptobacillus moniliformis]|uniref:PTS sugar transporter subunit IIC n=1 Tax=Streptobacillus moniliformis TaxID=34105 RepID=UPI0018F2AEE2